MRDSLRSVCACAGAVIAALIWLNAALSAAAVSDELKNLVVRDCSAAAAGLVALNAEERDELVRYLLFMLELSPQMLEVPEVPVFSGQPGGLPAPAPNVVPRELVRLLDFPQQQKAKACALVLLPKLVPESVSVLPQLVGLAAKHQPSLDPGLSAKLGDVIGELALTGGNSTDDLVGERFYASLIQLLLTPAEPYAERVLIEFNLRARPALLKAARVSQHKRQKTVLRLLREIGLQDEWGVGALISLSQAEDPSLRAWALQGLGSVDGPYDRVLPVLAARLQDPDAGVQGKAAGAMLRAAERLALQTEKPKLPDEFFVNLVRQFAEVGPGQRNVIADLLLALKPAPEGVPALLQAQSAQGTSSLRAAALVLGARLFPEEPSSLRASEKGLDDEAPAVAQAAMAALGFLPRQTQRIPGVILRVLKRAGALSDHEEQARIISAAADALVRLNLGKESEPALHYAWEALRYPVAFKVEAGSASVELLQAPFEDGPVAALYVLAGVGAGTQLIKAMSSKEPLVRKRAAMVVGRMAQPTPAEVAALSELLRDSHAEVREQALTALAHCGKSAVPKLKRALTWSPHAARLAAARALVRVSPGAAEALPVLREALDQRPCSEKEKLAADFVGAGAAGSAYLQQELLKCLDSATSGSAYLAALLQAKPLSAPNHAALLVMLKEGRLPLKTQFGLFEHAADLGFGSAEVMPYLIQSLRSGDTLAVLEAVKLLGDYSAEAQAAVAELLNLWRNGENGDLLRHRLALAIVLIDPQAIDYGAFFKQELQSDRYELLAETVSRLGAERSLPPLIEGLSAENDAEKLRALRFLAKLGAAGAPAIPKVEPLLTEGQGELAYEALLTLISLGDAGERVQLRLRAALVGSDWARLKAEDGLPEGMRGLLETVQSSSPSRFERLRAGALLERMGAEESVGPE